MELLYFGFWKTVKKIDDKPGWVTQENFPIKGKGKLYVGYMKIGNGNTSFFIHGKIGHNLYSHY